MQRHRRLRRTRSPSHREGKDVGIRVGTIAVSFSFPCACYWDAWLSPRAFAATASSTCARDGSERLGDRPKHNLLSAFIEESGLQDELQVNNSRLLGNMRLLNAMQRKVYPSGRREACKKDGPQADAVDMKEAHRIMKFSTAAYGQQVIASAVFETGERVAPAPHTNDIDAVMKHVCISDKNDIVVFVMDFGEDLDCLRHYCAVDHAHKAVVLAVRGTYSVSSSTMVDLAGYCDDFCGGKAHAGMSKMARGIWNRSGEAIVERLNQLPDDYVFIIGGHSLGAGVAGLINILVHREQLIPSDRQVRCYVYGSPPTFAPLIGADDSIMAAIQGTTAVVYQRDLVPFISVFALCRFLRLVAAMDKLKVRLWRKVLIDHEILSPSEDMLAAYRSADNEELLPLEQAPMVFVPAKAIVWLKRKKKASRLLVCTRDEYVATICDPHKLAEVGPVVTPGGIADHVTGRYEHALHFADVIDTLLAIPE
jgi:hypothetical protein